MEFNIRNVEKVKVFDFTTSVLTKWKPKIKRYGFLMQKEGIYRRGFRKWYPSVLGKNQILTDDNVVMDNPHVDVRFVSGQTDTHWFKTKEAAQNFADRIIHQMNK